MLPYLISISVIILIYFLLRARRKRIEAQGVVQDFWDTNQAAIGIILTFLMVTILGTDASDFREAFGEIGQMVRHVDTLVTILTALWFSVGKLKEYIVKITSVVMILISVIGLQAQDKVWIQHTDGKYYEVLVKSKGKKSYEDKKWDIIYSEYMDQRSTYLTTQGIGDKVKDVIDFIKKHRFTEQERNIYNFGVKKGNEILGGDVLEKIE